VFWLKAGTLLGGMPIFFTGLFVLPCFLKGCYRLKKFEVLGAGYAGVLVVSVL
jgi:hypothetical protein